MIITQTPLRISFLEEVTDFRDYYSREEGAVLTTAIDKCIFVIVKRRYDRLIRIGYTKTELVERVDQIQHELIREALLMTGITEKIEIGTLGDIPSTGSGLGSSGSVTVGVLNALYMYINQPKSVEHLAQKACEIEIDRLNKPIGKQDQYIAAFGGIKYIRFLPDEGVIVEDVRLSDSIHHKLNQHLILFDTNMARQADTLLTEQKANINPNRCALRILRDMAAQGKNLLEQGKLDDFGRLLHESWKLKKTLASQISNPTLDNIYEKAIKAGAIGGKITGAGGGGFLLLFCPRDRQDQVRDALGTLNELPFHLEPDSSKVIFNYRRQGE